MTENDWGRFYELDDNDGIILPPRAYYYRDMLTGNWADLALGMTYCVQKTDVDPGNDNTAMVNEQLQNTGSTNLFHFGLSSSNGGSGVPDLYDNQNFLGLRGIEGTTSQLIASSSLLTYLAATKITQGAIQTAGSQTSIPMRSAHVGANAFCRLGVRLTHDRFRSKLYVHISYEASIDPTDAEDVAELRTFLQAISNSSGNTFMVFNGITSVSQFRSFFLYWPFLLNRVKLHCVGAVKIG